MIRLSTEYTARGRALAAGGYWDKAEKAWVTQDPTARQAAIICAMFPELLGQHPELLAKRDELYGEARPVDYATKCNRRLSVDFPGAWDGLGVEPYDYQDIDAGYLANQMPRLDGGFLGWDRGLGKTISSLAIGRALGAKRILIVCGNTMKLSVWGDEIKDKWEDAPLVSVVPNEKAKRERWVADHKNMQGRTLVAVMHYESLAIVAGDKGRGSGLNALGHWDLMIFDEAHRLANDKTNLHRATMKARKRSKMALALTGTAIMNKGEDLFGQLKFCFPKVYKSKWKDWNDRFLDYERTDYGQVCIGFRPDALPELRDELGRFMVHRKKNDVLDLPKRTEETRYVTLSKGQRKAYDDMLTQFWTELESGDVLQASNALAQLNLLRRIATGLDAVDNTVTDSSKLDFAEALIDENPEEAFVVFSWYKAPLLAFADRLTKKGVGHHVITGDTPQKDREPAVRAFQAGAGRVFLGTLSTLGESVNLQRASSCIFLDRAWNPAVNAQAADRIYRIGQDRPVTITHLVARNTVDELRVQPVLASKEALIAAVFGKDRS